MTSSKLRQVALAISAFSADDSVIRLLEKAFRNGRGSFGAVFVVESLATGRIAEVARERGWAIHYENSITNLGSAGNLARRLTLAAQTSCDWCLALNHDGDLDLAKAEALVDCAKRHDRVGAVYPRLRFTRAEGRLDRPRKGYLATSILEDPDEGSDLDVAVKWSSSNGALYAVEPIRQGLPLWQNLWMGYEDLAIGWELDRAGWSQWLCTSAQVDDDYEYRAVHLPGKTMFLADKPPWYDYYAPRNLLILAKGSRLSAVSLAGLASRLAADVLLILLTRDQKFYRTRLWLRGLVDGLMGAGGKGPVP